MRRHRRLPEPDHGEPAAVLPIIAEPGTGKTTFCDYAAARYYRRLGQHTIAAHWENELVKAGRCKRCGPPSPTRRAWSGA